MDVQHDWARIVEAASDPTRTRTVEQRVPLLRTALALGSSVAPDSVASSVTVSTGLGYETPAASSGVAMDLDIAQYADQNGPCIDACRDGQPHYIVIMADEDDYPRFTRAAVQHGIHSSLSLPLRSQPAAALNLYAAGTDAFTGDQLRATAELLARCVANFLPELGQRGSAHSAQPAAMAGALERREQIRRACRRLTADGTMSEVEAFGVLTDRSRSERRSIFAVAAEVNGAGDGVGTDGGARR